MAQNRGVLAEATRDQRATHRQTTEHSPEQRRAQLSPPGLQTHRAAQPRTTERLLSSQQVGELSVTLQ